MTVDVPQVPGDATRIRFEAEYSPGPYPTVFDSPETARNYLHRRRRLWRPGSMTVDRGPHPVAWGRFWSIWDDGLFLPRVEATISADMSVPRMAVEALQLVADAGNCAHVPAALVRPLVSAVGHTAQRLSGWTVRRNIYDYSMSLTRHDFTLAGGANHPVWQVAVQWHREDPHWDANSVYDGRFHNVYGTEREARQAPEKDYRHDATRGSEQRDPELDLE